MGAQFKNPDYREHDWLEYAYCKGLDPDIFFANSEPEQLEAARICGGCAVRAECLEYALITNQKDGVWGGTTEREREGIRKDWLKRYVS